MSKVLFPLFYYTQSKSEFPEGGDGNSTPENYFGEQGFLKLTGAVHAYNTYIKNKGIGKNETPFVILEQMREQNIIPDIGTYNTLIYLCFKDNKPDYALEFFHQCCQNDSEIHPDIVTFNSYIKGLIMIHDNGVKILTIEGIPKLFNDIRKLKG